MSLGGSESLETSRTFVPKILDISNLSKLTYQKFTFTKERQNLVLQIFDENVLRQEPKGTVRFCLCQVTYQYVSIHRIAISTCVSSNQNVTKNIGNYLLSLLSQFKKFLEPKQPFMVICKWLLQLDVEPKWLYSHFNPF